MAGHARRIAGSSQAAAPRIRHAHDEEVNTQGEKAALRISTASPITDALSASNPITTSSRTQSRGSIANRKMSTTTCDTWKRSNATYKISRATTEAPAMAWTARKNAPLAGPSTTITPMPGR